MPDRYPVLPYRQHPTAAGGPHPPPVVIDVEAYPASPPRGYLPAPAPRARRARVVAALLLAAAGAGLLWLAQRQPPAPWWGEGQWVHEGGADQPRLCLHA